MSRGKVLIAAPVHPVLLEDLESAGYTLERSESITQALAYELIADCVGLITSTRLNVDRPLLDAAPRLRWIGRMGSGMEVIDVAYASEKGITCFSSPEGNCNAVAEHALGMLLSLTKKITSSHQEVKEGKWIRDANRGIELEGKTIGIIGFGHTGQAFARKLSVFDMQILVYDKYKIIREPAYVTPCPTLDRIIEESDIVSFHVPLQEDTYHYFNEDFCRKMRKNFFLVNTSRGSVVDIFAVEKGLKQEKIAGACLDVLEEEPLDRMSGASRESVSNILKQSNVIITPHIAGYSHESLYKMSKALSGKIVRLR